MITSVMTMLLFFKLVYLFMETMSFNILNKYIRKVSITSGLIICITSVDMTFLVDGVYRV